MLEHEVIIMKKLFKVVTFTVFPDGSYRQEYGNGAHSAMMFDFADLFITLSANGWRMKQRWELINHAQPGKSRLFYAQKQQTPEANRVNNSSSI